MPYCEVEPSGSSVVKGRGKLRLDLFLNEDDPHFDKCYVSVPVIPEGGYPGKVDKEGSPVNQADYDAWVLSLPHIWQNNPFHSHKIWLPPDGICDDNWIKEQIERTLNYFYQLHQYAWDKGLNWIDEWKKVPFRAGSVRDRFVRGEAKHISANETKIANVLSRVQDFQIGVSRVPPQDLNIGEKGTIDVGSEAILRDTSTALYHDIYGYKTIIDYNNPANDSGSLDTVETYTYQPSSGNSLKAGTFQDNGSGNFTCHDAEECGECFAGYNVFTGLSIDINSGEYLGADARAAYTLKIDYATSGYSGIYFEQGQYCDPEDTRTFYTHDADACYSLYGTGDGGGGEVMAGIYYRTIMQGSGY